MKKYKKQGVSNIITFPFGQDERAIGKAISCLLREGWKFYKLKKTEILFIRCWEDDPEKEMTN